LSSPLALPSHHLPLKCSFLRRQSRPLSKPTSELLLRNSKFITLGQSTPPDLGVSVLHFVNPEASPVLQYPASPDFLSPLPEEFSLLGPPRVVTSPPRPPTVLIAETFDSEVFEIPNPEELSGHPLPLP